MVEILQPATPVDRNLHDEFTTQKLPAQNLLVKKRPLENLPTEQTSDDELPGARNSQSTSQQGSDEGYKELVRKLTATFPNMSTNEPRGVDVNIKESLLETLYDNTAMGPTMFVQAPAVKIYSGEHKPGDMNELTWFGQVVNLARNTRQTLLQCLISHTSGTALKWVTLKAKHNARANTQLRNITKGSILVDQKGALTDLKGTPIIKLTLLSDTEITEAFGRQFLTYRQDDVETSKLFLEQNKCVQREGQSLENYIIQFQTLLMEAEIDTSTVKDQFNLVMHFYHGLLPGLKKHGYTNTFTLRMYSNLQSYWNFLRKHVQKDDAKRLVEKDLQGLR
jgi:hypothetical protein